MLIGLGLGLTQARRAAAAGGGFAAWSHGFNFRGSSGLVTDAASDTYVIGAGATAYSTPRTVNGDALTFGAEGSLSTIDRSGAVDARFAGVWATDNSAAKSTFRVDLPSAGTYDIRLAIGDLTAGEGLHTVELIDNATSKFVISGASTLADNYLDANGTNFTRANWITSNVARSVVFASTILRITIGQGTGTGGTFSTVTHLKITRTA